MNFIHKKIINLENFLKLLNLIKESHILKIIHLVFPKKDLFSDNSKDDLNKQKQVKEVSYNFV